MAKNEINKRDELGNIIMPKLSSDFWEKERDRQWTHVFQFKDSNGFFHKVDYNGRNLENLRPDFPRFNLITVDIFKPPDNLPYVDWINWRNKFDYYLEKFFRPVFANRPMEEAFPLRIEKNKVVLPVEKYAEFRAFIDEYSLKEYEDFILYLLCSMESNYIREIAFYDRPKEKERIKNFPKEVENLIKALKLDKIDFDDVLDNKKTIPILEQIKFTFNSEDPIKINDRLLLSSITDAIRNHFKDGPRKDWEKQLRSFPAVFNENKQPNEFRYRMCKALHNFFKEVDAFNFGNLKTKDKEVHAIGWMMYFAHIKFQDKNGNDYDISIDRNDLKQTVRKHIERKELVYHPTQYHADEIKPNFENLLKYFDRDFIQVGDPVYNDYNMRVVFGITDRFKVNHLFPEIMHLFNCLNTYRIMIGHQLEANFNEAAFSKNIDYLSLKALVTTLRNKGNISEMQFKLSDNTVQYGFVEKAPLEIMKQALLEYYDNHKVEFEIDLCETKVVLGIQNSSFSVTPTGKLNEPQNRFLPCFTKKAYQFLLNEAPPNDNSYLPSNDYFGIIGSLLLVSNFFGHQAWEENHIFEQVKYWHSL